jgi:thiamine-monophosphate kinase
VLYVDQLPLSTAMQQALLREKAVELALSAGDDYELCFTVPVTQQKELEKQLSSIPCRYTCIGTITKQLGLEIRYQNGNTYHGSIEGFQHFS